MTISGTDIGSLAIDSQSLNKLKLQAKQAPDQALKAAAKQFESVFLNMMLKSMRDATPQDGVFDSEQTKMFTGMLDQQLAQSMASRGVGLADVMVKQLSRNQQAATSFRSCRHPRATHAVPSAYKADVQQSFIDKLRVPAAAGKPQYRRSGASHPGAGCAGKRLGQARDQDGGRQQ